MSLKKVWIAPWLMLAVAAVSATTFDIHWRNVGLLRSNQPGAKPVAERPQARISRLPGLTIERVQINPSVVGLQVGQTYCLTNLDVGTYGPGAERIAGALLTVEVQQPHLSSLELLPSDRDICFKAAAAGEYPIRVTSVAPARDHTIRGAQVFIRVTPSE